LQSTEKRRNRAGPGSPNRVIIGAVKFSIGDRVAFLNESLDGEVVRLLGDDLVKVRVPDGFEFDVSEKELVLIKKAGGAEIPASPAPAMARKALAAESDVFQVLDGRAFYFAACPGEDLQVLTGPVRFYVVNKLEYEAAYSFAAQAGNTWSNLAAGTVAPGASQLLCSCRRADLVDWRGMNLQAVFHKKGVYSLLPPLNKDLPLQFPDLKTGDYKLPGQWAYSKITRLVSDDLPLPDWTALKEKYAPRTTDREASATPRKAPRPPESGPVLINETEVDLHIQHLADDYKSLGNAEMLQIQMKRFRQEMDAALKHHYKKAVFIHGVGNGVLRNEIRRELRAYPGIVVRDAPFEKYGYGATEVVFL
jgi:hypothetical protein